MKYVAAVLFISLIGCSTREEMTTLEGWPEIISLAPLPPLARRELKLRVIFHVLNDGSVADVKLLGTSGDPQWDTLAAETMKQWRFTPSPHDSTAGGRWIPKTVVVKIEDQVVIDLGELVAPSRELADSLYSLLEHGSDFDTLATHSWNGSSTKLGSFLGTVDIVVYPKHIRDELRKLSVNEFTHPLRLGADYIIYKRFKSERFPRFSQ